MSEQANTTAAAEVSSEYLSDIRLRVRSSVDKLDGEIKDLILAARADLVRGGVLPARAADETDPLVKQAISTYVKAEFGLDNDDADKYRASFRSQKIGGRFSSTRNPRPDPSSTPPNRPETKSPSSSRCEARTMRARPGSNTAETPMRS